MTVHRKVERFADPKTSKTPLKKEPTPDLGHDFIPKERYTSPQFATLEWDHMWTKVWLMGAWIGDLKEPGDYVVTEIGKESVVITKDESGQYNAFYNVCSHRGNQVAYAREGNTQSFTCSYHAWKYNLRGELIDVPDSETFPQGVPCEKLSIKKLPCDVWGAWVWFSLNPDVEPLREYLGEMPEHLDPYHFEKFALVADMTIEWACNWKTCVDAFNESYHVRVTHPQIINFVEDYDIQIDLYDKHSRYLLPFGSPSSHIEEVGEVSSEQRTYMTGFGMDGDAYEGTAVDGRRALQQFMRTMDKERGFDFSDLNDDQLSDDYHYFIFPNITYNLHPHTFLFFRQRPHEADPNRMYFDLQVYDNIPEGQNWPHRPGHSQFKNGEQPYHPVLQQDADNCETQQKGLNSGAFRGMWLSDQEIRVRHLHKTLDDYMKQKPAKSPLDERTFEAVNALRNPAAARGASQTYYPGVE